MKCPALHLTPLSLTVPPILVPRTRPEYEAMSPPPPLSYHLSSSFLTLPTTHILDQTKQNGYQTIPM